MFDSQSSMGKPVKHIDLSTKILLLGDTGVGKTTLINKFSGQESINTSPTVGADLCNMDVLIEGVPLKAKIWDTAGNERYMMLNRNFYRGALGAMLVFDLTREIEKENIEKWMIELKEATQEHTCIVLVGNKNDLNINPESSYFLREYTEDHKLKYFETSAKKGIGVDEAFEALFTEVKKKHLDTKGHIDHSSYSFKLSITKIDTGKSSPNCQC